MTVQKKEMIYEGKAKKIYSTSEPQKLIQEFKDSLTAFNAKKKGNFEGKGGVNLKITSCIFKYLKENGVPSHFIETLNEREMLVEKLTIIPLEVVVRNKAAGSICTRLGLKEGSALPRPLVEFFYKKDELNDPLVTEDHILMLGIATEIDLVDLRIKALRINELLKKMFVEIGIDLIDFKIEFGKTPTGGILLADEISPDSCRLWDSKTGEKLDKDRFRQDLGHVEENYRLVCEKILKRWEHS